MTHSDEILIWLLLWGVVTCATVAVAALTSTVVGGASIRRDYADIQSYFRGSVPRAWPLDLVCAPFRHAPPPWLFSLVWFVLYAGLLAVRTAMSSCAFNLVTVEGLHAPVSSWHAIYLSTNLLESTLSAMWFPTYFGAGLRKVALVILALDVAVSALILGLSFETSQCIRLSNDGGDTWRPLILLCLFVYQSWLLYALSLNWVGCTIDAMDGAAPGTYHSVAEGEREREREGEGGREGERERERE
jgi:hypothetical protein